MKLLTALVLVLFNVVFHIGAPVASYAYMTLFNDNGNWVAATLMNPEDEKVTYRACKNSNDRNTDAKSEGSLAIVCITVYPTDDKAMLGIWHSESLAKPGEELACVVKLDNNKEIYKNCKVIPSRYVTEQIVLSQDKKEIAKILVHNKLKLYLENKTGGDTLESLEFDLDPETLRKAANKIYEFF